jgi:hypothetical protein
MHRIERQFEKLDRATAQLLTDVRTMPASQYRQQPGPGAWSVAQIANHVFLSEYLSLAYLRKKLAYPDQVPRYHPKSWLGIALIKVVFALRIKVKAPPTIDMDTKPDLLELDALEEKWKALRAETKSFIAAHHQQFGDHLPFRHLFAGRMTFLQMLIFFREHLNNHHRQIRRIMEKND